MKASLQITAQSFERRDPPLTSTRTHLSLSGEKLTIAAPLNRSNHFRLKLGIDQILSETCTYFKEL